MPLNARKAAPAALAALLAIMATGTILPAHADGPFPTSLATEDQQRLEAFGSRHNSSACDMSFSKRFLKAVFCFCRLATCNA